MPRRVFKIKSLYDLPPYYRREVAGRLRRRIEFADNGCWLWTASTTDGYGQMKVNGKYFRAFRLAYELFVGAVPEGLQLDHLCHTADETCAGGETCIHRRCCNPEHLEPVTVRENLLRGRGFNSVNAAKTHCLRGHPLSGDNLYIEPKGSRSCKTCRAESTRRSQAKRKVVS